MTQLSKFLPKGTRPKVILGVVVGFLVGSAWLVALRFATYKSDHVHYHANFAMYVEGQRDKFDSFTFYEEVQACESDEADNPRTRVHLHDNVNHVIHVHDTAATWGHLFANLGYNLGDKLLKNDDGVFVDGASQKKLTFWLNGKQVDGVANRTIKSEDTLLINYGDDSLDVLQSRYDAIPKDAAEYNRRDDPSACSGSGHGSFSERLKAALGLD